MKCKHCGEPITGGKGDYWHFDEYGKTGDMRCADGKNLAQPDAWDHSPGTDPSSPSPLADPDSTVTITLSREDAQWWTVTNRGLSGPRGRLYEACREALDDA